MQLIFAPILGCLSDKHGRRPVLFLSIIGTGIGFLVLGLATTLWMLFASYSVMQLNFAPILGGVSDKHGRRPVLFLSIIGTGIGFLVLGLATTLWMLFAGRILDGIT